MSSFKNSMLSPTEQGAISKALGEVITARNSGDIEYYWRCTETLYITCLALKKGVDKLQKKLDPIYEKSRNISCSNYDKIQARKQANQLAFQYKITNVSEVHKSLMVFLRENEYGETALGASPLNQEKPHMGMTPR
ncbi:MAG: hypothetical protein WC325_13435 [Candidatus Bathyarchaeia archaeon]